MIAIPSSIAQPNRRLGSREISQAGTSRNSSTAQNALVAVSVSKSAATGDCPALTAAVPGHAALPAGEVGGEVVG